MLDRICFENISFLEQHLQGEIPSFSLLKTETDADLYRLWGHLEAAVVPSGIKKRPFSSLLPQMKNFELKKMYCGRIGFEVAHIHSQDLQRWLIEVIESSRGSFDVACKQLILRELIRAEMFETFLHTKYVGKKRFSIEGAETVIPIIVSLLETAVSKEIEEVVIGMSHRGRLNVLANVLHKPYKDMFLEFEDVATEPSGRSGDVRYHKGYKSTVSLPSGRGIELWMPDNPSHLESVDPVAEGIVRSHQDRGKKSLPLLIHGDAAIAGQGVVYETLQLSGLEGYKTGGTIHIVINNHIGFTVSPEDARTSYYCTDIAKAFGFPVFHVNAEDPESAVWAVERAFEIRQQFGVDVFIDLNCTRKYGHNEGDEPAFTQPLAYREIRKKTSIRALYTEKLIAESVITKAYADGLEKSFHEELQNAFHEVKEQLSFVELEKKPMKNSFVQIDTSVDRKVLEKVAKEISKIPEELRMHPRVHQAIAGRAVKLEANFPEFSVDWSFAEALAIGTLLLEGKSVRLSGQDVRRGTFSHRHGVWVDQETEQKYSPLHALVKDPKQFVLIDSPLSEYAALGFEYGYSLSDTVTIWEAQFGDFANGAQVIIDQYLAAGEQKWGVRSGLILLLPHGYEGQGPEHSSARIERFLSLCGDDNMVIVNPTTPSQLFHLLRRHSGKKPLVIFTPKSLLRHPQCISAMKELQEGHFQEVIDDDEKFRSATRILFCQGKVFYDLEAERREREDASTAIIRIEQLYPLHHKKIEEIVSRYSSAEQFLWVQEEPYNMGAWGFLREQIDRVLPRNKRLEYRGRPVSSSPAVGYHHVHEKESEQIMRSLYKEKE